MDYMILQSKPASTRVCDVVAESQRSLWLASRGRESLILMYELLIVTVPQHPSWPQRDMEL
jgi:hypothetical protein